MGTPFHVSPTRTVEAVLPKEPPEIAQLRALVGRNGWPEPPLNGKKRPKILFFMVRNWLIHGFWEGLMARALTARGAECVFYTCGGGLSICGINTCHFPNPAPCQDCYPYNKTILDLMQLPHMVLKDLVTEQEIQDAHRRVEALDARDLTSFEHHGLALGQMIRYSVRWYLRTGTIDLDETSVRITRRILADAVVMALAGERLLEKTAPASIVMVNGLFYPERILSEIARRKGIDVIQYEQGNFVPDTLFVTRRWPACHYEMGPLWERYRDVPLTPEEDSRLDRYLHARSEGKKGTSSFWPSMNSDRNDLLHELKIPAHGKIVTLFTNVVGDTAVQDKDIAFSGVLDWMAETIRYFMDRKGIQLVIRIHPGEIRPLELRPAVAMKDSLHAMFPTLPPHIHVIPPESDLSSYTLMDISDVGLVYTSTVGLEMTLKGMTVVVAGRPHYRDRGFTLDMGSREEYFRILEEVTRGERFPLVPVELARRYAYTLFFRCLLPFPLVTQTKRCTTQLTMSSLDELSPGHHSGLDAICTGILDHKEFFMP